MTLVLNWNGYEDTRACLDSLQRIDDPRREVYLIDNASSGEDVALLRAEFGAHLTRVIVNKENLGFAEGNNVGIRQALETGADYILLLNNDTIVEPDFLREMLVVIESDPKIGIVGPRLLNLGDPGTLQSAGGIIYPLLGVTRQRGFNKPDGQQYSHTEDVDFVSMACALIRRDVFERIGMISSTYFLQWEDIDFCARAGAAGFRCVYAPRSRVHHRLSASFRRAGQSTSMVRRGWRNRIWFFRRHLRGWRFAVFTVCFAVFTVPAYLTYQLVVYRSLARARAMLDGIRNGLEPFSEDPIHRKELV